MSLPDSSAQIRDEPARAAFRPPDVPVDVPVNGPRNVPVNPRKLRSGTGSNLAGLPDLPGVDWEVRKNRPGVEAWHVPVGAFRRADKTYLGYLNAQRLAEWDGKPNRRELVAEWIAAKRREKGISA